MSIDLYNRKLQQYLDGVTTDRIIIELTKCCGYSQFQMYYNKYTLAEFYQNMAYEWSNTTKLDLFVLDGSGQRLDIPKYINSITLREFISNNRRFFIPIYPVPAKVVYRIYLDDGHTHADDCSSVFTGLTGPTSPISSTNSISQNNQNDQNTMNTDDNNDDITG